MKRFLVFMVLMFVLQGCKVWTKEEVGKEIANIHHNSNIRFVKANPNDNTADVHKGIFFVEYRDDGGDIKQEVFVVNVNFYGTWIQSLLKRKTIEKLCTESVPTYRVGMLRGNSGWFCLTTYPDLPSIASPCNTELTSAATLPVPAEASWVLACTYFYPDIWYVDLESIYGKAYIIKDFHYPDHLYLEKYQSTTNSLQYVDIFGDSSQDSKQLQNYCMGAKEIDQVKPNGEHYKKLACNSLTPQLL